MFIVKGNSGRPSEAEFVAKKSTPKDAMLAAVDLLGQGMSNVMIVDRTGQTFRPAEFANLYMGDLSEQ